MMPIHRRCDGVTRRKLLRIGGLTAFGLTISDWFRMRAAGSLSDKTSKPPRSCILIWLDGGPSHLDTLDPKPEAPREVRGPFQPISTKVPGFQISELMPSLAQLTHRISIIRSMTSPLGEHNFGSHYMLTGYRPNPALTYPSFGSVRSNLDRSARTLPSYIHVGDRPNTMMNAGYLSSQHRPFVIQGDPARPDFQVQDLNLFPGVTEERLKRRRDFLDAFDRFDREAQDSASGDGILNGGAFERAYRLVMTPASRKAFDLDEEKPKLRSRYGSRTLGQSCLLARRLVEAGVPFVTVTDRGWDTHTDLYTRLKEGYTGGSVGKVPTLDRALSTLIEDLGDRGLLDETLIIAMGEFGRTPKITTAGGRDHWPRVFSVLLAGGGVPGGQIIGSSDANAESPKDRPVTPTDLACTVYKILGIDVNHEFMTGDGRPVPVNQGGRVITELMGSA